MYIVKHIPIQQDVILDANIINDLRQSISNDSLHKIFQKFIHTLQTIKLPQLEAAIYNKNYQQQYKIAHYIKSGAAQLGLGKIYYYSHLLSKARKETGSQEQISTYLLAIKVASKETTTAFTQFLTLYRDRYTN